MSYTRGTSGIIADFSQMSIPKIIFPLAIFIFYKLSTEYLANPSPKT